MKRRPAARIFNSEIEVDETLKSPIVE